MVKIYALLDPNTKQPRYVGKTKQKLNQRLNKHIYNKNNNAPINKWIRSKIKEHKNIKISLIEECSEDSWKERESYWIKKYKNKYDLMNIAPGGESGCESYNHTEEAKKKISKANSGKKSKEWMDNAAKAMRKVTATPIIQYSRDGLFIKEWKSFCYAAKEIRPENYKSCIKNIHACCNGKRKSAYGFLWKYKKDVEV